MWEAFVDVLRSLIFTAAHICGGNLGAGVLLVSAGIRLALMPLTLRMARHAREQQRRLALITPALEKLQKRFANDPARLWSETRALHAAHGIRFASPVALLGFAVQLPLLSGLYSAVRKGLGSRVRFLWIGDLARPDFLLLAGAAVLTAISLSAGPATPGQPSASSALLMVGVATTLIFLWSAPSTVTLSMCSSAVVSLVQNVLVARGARDEANAVAKTKTS